MNIILLLFGIGLVLFFFEVITPGGILGLFGGVAMIAGSAYAFWAFGPWIGTWTTIAAVVAVAGMLWLELQVLPKTRFGRGLLLDAAIDGTTQPPLPAGALVGSFADAATDFSPTGFVLIEGRKYEAYCRDGFVQRGTRLKVVAVDSFHLIVSKI